MATLTLFVYISTVQDFPRNVHMAISKTRSTRSTEHTEHGAVEKRKSFIIKYTVYYYKFLLLLIKFFRVLHVGGSKKIGLLKNTYAKLPKAIVVFKIGL